jgi:EAL domain-containing protein (putative c-di-GMP-specific phosphodiesterase class I)
MEVLRESGVDYAQGFHIGEPQPATDTFTRPLSA